MAVPATQPAPPRPNRTPLWLRRTLFALAGLVAITLVAYATISLLDLASRHTTTVRSEYRDVERIVVEDAEDIRLVGAPAGRPVVVVARVTEGLRSPSRQVRQRDDGTLNLSSSCPVFFTNQCNVRYEVHVPAGTPLRADSSAGDVVAEDLVGDAPISLSTSAGDITVDGVYGPALDLWSSAGEVEARNVRVEELRARSSAGDVSVAMTRTPDAVDAHSSAGDVSLIVPDAVYDVDAETSAGEVDRSNVRHDPDVDRTLRARSSAGDVRIDVRR